MKFFIKATGTISPQNTFGHTGFLTEPAAYFGNRLKCIEPDYKAYIDIKQIRRMSRIIKIGVTAAISCLQEAGVEVPGAIVTGTAYGCLEDTGVFFIKDDRTKRRAPYANGIYTIHTQYRWCANCAAATL